MRIGRRVQIRQLHRRVAGECPFPARQDFRVVQIIGVVGIDCQNLAGWQQGPAFLVIVVVLALARCCPRHRLQVQQRLFQIAAIGQHVRAVGQHHGLRVADRRPATRRRHGGPCIGHRIVDRPFRRVHVRSVIVLAAIDDQPAIGEHG
jgi:hypothetical protein